MTEDAASVPSSAPTRCRRLEPVQCARFCPRLGLLLLAATEVVVVRQYVRRRVVVVVILALPCPCLSRCCRCRPALPGRHEVLRRYGALPHLRSGCGLVAIVNCPLRWCWCCSAGYRDDPSVALGLAKFRYRPTPAWHLALLNLHIKITTVSRPAPAATFHSDQRLKLCIHLRNVTWRVRKSTIWDTNTATAAGAMSSKR